MFPFLHLVFQVLSGSVRVARRQEEDLCVLTYKVRMCLRSLLFPGEGFRFCCMTKALHDQSGHIDWSGDISILTLQVALKFSSSFELTAASCGKISARISYRRIILSITRAKLLWPGSV